MEQDEVRELIVVKVAATMRALEQTSLKGPQDLRLITDAPVPSPGPGEVRALLDGYIAAFEHSDAGLLAEVLRADATLEATPFRDWQAGRVDCIHMLDAYVLGEPGDWRMVATSANRQPTAAVYFREADGKLRANGIVVLDPTVGGVSRVIAFHHDPALVAMFGFPDVLAD